MFSRKFFSITVIQKLCELHTVQCGNYENSLSHFFGKNFVKATHLLNTLNRSLKSWFDGKNFQKKTEFVSQTLSSSQISNDHLWRNRHICTCHPHTTDVFREESQKRLSLHFFLYSLLQRLLYCRRNSRDLNCFYSVIFPLDKWLMLTGML